MILSYQVLTKGLQRRSSAANQPDKDKMKEGCVEVSRGSCSKGSWRHFFEVTGNILFQILSQECVWSKIFLETWALPITVLFAVVAYAVLAAVFYDMDA